MRKLILSIAVIAAVYLPTSAQQITGTIATETGVLVQNVEVPPTTTNSEGFYEIQNPTLPFIIEPSKNDDPLNGVNVCDLVALTNHFLRIELLDSPYKLIAADLNSSNAVSTIDLIMLDRLLLGISTDLAPNESWRFVDADFVFPDPTDPFSTGVPPSVVVNNLDQDFVGDFIGIKVGDLNNSAVGTSTGPEPSNLETWLFEFSDSVVPAQDSYEVNFTTTDFTDVLGLQFTLSYDPTKMELFDIKTNTAANSDFGVMNFNPSNVGAIGGLWVYNALMGPLSIPDGETIFTAKFKILEDIQLSESLMFTNEFLPLVTRNSEGCFGESGVPDFMTSTSDNDISSLSTINIFPNPTQGLFDLQLELNSSKEVNVVLYNVVGINLLEKNYNSQLVNDQIDMTHLANGIYFLSINVEGEILTRRIVKG